MPNSPIHPYCESNHPPIPIYNVWNHTSSLYMFDRLRISTHPKLRFFLDNYICYYNIKKMSTISSTGLYKGDVYTMLEYIDSIENYVSSNELDRSSNTSGGALCMCIYKVSYCICGSTVYVHLLSFKLCSCKNTILASTLLIQYSYLLTIF
jgi:hypothetical protein